MEKMAVPGERVGVCRIVVTFFVDVQFAVEVLDLVKQTLPVASAAAQLASKVLLSRSAVCEGDDGDIGVGGDPIPPPYSDADLLHYATVETEHPYKQASVSHFKVSQHYCIYCTVGCRNINRLCSSVGYVLMTSECCGGVTMNKEIV